MPAACTLDACRICTPCYHGNHPVCAGTVTCPDDGQSRPCTCCGTIAA